MGERRWIWLFAAGMLAAFGLATLFSQGYVNWQWFGHLGYRGVFWTALAYRWGVGVTAGLLAAAVLFVNLLWARRAFSVFFLNPESVPPQLIPWLRPRRQILLLGVIAGLTGVAMGLSTADQWMTVASWWNQVPFGQVDPVFHRDIGFYVFTLPFLRLVYSFLETIVVLSLLVTGFLYFMTGAVALFDRRLHVYPAARAHLGILVGVYFLLLAWRYRLDMFGLLFSNRSVASGPGYTDLHVLLPGLGVMIALALAAAGAAFALTRLTQLRWLGYAVAAVALGSILVAGVVPALVQRLVVVPNQLVKERPYIENAIQATLRAWNLDHVEARNYQVRQDLDYARVEADQGTVSNIRLWDWRFISRAYQQLQGIRTYYTFDAMTVDRYMLGGTLRQVVLSGREIAYDNLPDASWVNQHLVYTHGYGVVATPAAEVTRDGMPPLVLRDIPPRGRPELAVRQPAIYFGLETRPYAIVGTTQKEFDYPRGSTNVYTEYRGRGDVQLGGFLQRLAFALAEGDYNVLLSSQLTARSQALIHRQVEERVARVAPFLQYDSSPYLVIDGGRLKWIVDAYTVSSYYPYAQSTGESGVNYMRNSVKAVVDATSGAVSFYVADPRDPLLRAYQRVFPGLFRPMAEMPAGLRAHIRYPQDLFEAQLRIYARYHMKDPEVFYNNEDLWTFPKEIVGGTTDQSPMEPYYAILQLPGESQPEFLLVMPLTPNNRDNMIAWLAARSDGSHYGELVLFNFPKQTQVFGPAQVESLINNNDQISQALTLWNQQGSRVLRGNLLVIPIDRSLLYVQPLYLESTSTQLPELRRVIASYAGRVAMEPTLDQALRTLFGVSGPPTAPATPAAPARPAPGPGAPGQSWADLVRRANQLYTQAQEAIRQGNWALYGERMAELAQVLQQLQQTLPAGPAGQGR
ncbi:MAG: UPF0182 family protein [Bacillota bacterium]|nr:UPF0182 family protein [Bacillota bacterium]